MSAVDDAKLFTKHGKEPSMPACQCVSAKTVALISAYSAFPVLLCSIIYFISISQDESLPDGHADTLIATTGFGSLLIVSLAAAFIYGVRHGKRFLMIPYMLVMCSALLSSVSAMGIVIAAIVTGIDRRLELWGEEHGLWRHHMISMSLLAVASVILVIVEFCVLISHLWYYRYLKETERLSGAKLPAA